MERNWMQDKLFIQSIWAKTTFFVFHRNDNALIINDNKYVLEHNLSCDLLENYLGYSGYILMKFTSQIQLISEQSS